MFGRGYEALGGDLIQPEEMSGVGELAYNANRFGTQGLVAGTGLQAASAARGVPATPQVGDFMLRPYAGGAGARAVIGDTASGVGSGVGLTAADEMYPDNEWAQLVGMLGGGVVGGAAGVAAAKPKDMLDYLAGFTNDPSIPYAPGSMAPTSRRVADLAARVVQGQTTNPATAGARIAERASAAREAGMPVPTAGIASDDIGLIGLERGLRQATTADNPSLRRQFLERDQAIKEGAADKVFGLRDPGADQPGALQYAKDRPSLIRQEREAAAIPILKKAEASGAQADPSEVVGVIEGTLAEAKRPAVRDAMTRALKLINLPGVE
jgi:hypothetical protein